MSVNSSTNSITKKTKNLFYNYVREQTNLITSKLTEEQFKTLKYTKKFYPQISNYDFAFDFSIKIKFIKAFNYMLNKYTNFSKLVNPNSFTEFINYADLFMLIKDSECKPFWNDQVKELSKKIFMPTFDNLVITNSPKTFSSTNWFGTEHYLAINKLDNIVTNTNPEPLNPSSQTIKTNKIKLYLNHKQKTILNRFMGGYRYFYNRTIQYVNNYDRLSKTTFYNYKPTINSEFIKVTIDLKDQTNKFSLITTRPLIKRDFPDWFDEIKMPSHLIDQAINEACDNYLKSMEKYKKTKLAFKLKPKYKKTKMQTMNLEASMIKGNGLFVGFKDSEGVNILKNIKSSFRFKNIKKIKDSSLSCNTRLNEWYLNATYEDQLNDTTNQINKVCSIDPGIKTFATIYDDSGITKIAKGSRETIKKICKELDIIQSKMSEKSRNHNSRRNLKRAYNHKYKYLENLRKDLHSKTVKHLTENYKRIIIPPFETQKLTEKLSSSDNRVMLTLSFYKFLTRLKDKCKEKQRELIIRPEYYTSKTCGCCGWINKNLSNSDVYNCVSCGLIIDRDMNGARNIMLRNLNESYLP